MKDETNEKRKDDMRKRVRHTQLMKLLTTPLLGSHVRIQLQLCKFFQAFFFQFFFLFHLGQEVLDPILTFFIRTRDESHCINKICPKTQRFQTFSQPVGWILLSTPMRERQLSSTVEVLALLEALGGGLAVTNHPSFHTDSSFCIIKHSETHFTCCLQWHTKRIKCNPLNHCLQQHSK